MSSENPSSQSLANAVAAPGTAAPASLGASAVPAFVHYVRPHRLSQFNQNQILAQIHYGIDPGTRPEFHRLQAQIPLAQLGDEPLVEVWTSDQGIDYFRDDGIELSITPQIVFGQVGAEFPSGGAELEHQVTTVYRELLDRIARLGYPHLIRVWNFFPHIRAELDGLECYRRFCRARHEALAGSDQEFQHRLPATSTLGTSSGQFHLLFIAARTGAEQLENPRQVSAYHYPRLYGPRSPSFARASLVPWWGQGALFVSGTASIVGHESRHIGSPEKQIHEVLNNVETLVERAVKDKHVTATGLADLQAIRVYIREPEYFELVRQVVQARIGTHVQPIYLQADICRRELLMEVEGAIFPARPR